MVVSIRLVFKDRLTTHDELVVICEHDETFRSVCHRAINEKELGWSHFAVMSVSGASYIDITTVVSPSDNDSRFYVQEVIASSTVLEKLPSSEVPLALYVRSSDFGRRLETGFYPVYGTMTILQMKESVMNMACGMWGCVSYYQFWNKDGTLDIHHGKRVKSILQNNDIIVVSPRSIDTAMDGGSPIMERNPYVPDPRLFDPDTINQSVIGALLSNAFHMGGSDESSDESSDDDQRSLPEPDAEAPEDVVEQTTSAKTKAKPPVAPNASFHFFVKMEGKADEKQFYIFGNDTMATLRAKVGEGFNLKKSQHKRYRIFNTDDNDKEITLISNYGSKFVKTVGIKEGNHLRFVPIGSGGGKSTSKSAVLKSKETKVATLKQVLDNNYNEARALSGKVQENKAITSLENISVEFAQAVEQNATKAFESQLQKLNIGNLEKAITAIGNTSGNPQFKLKKASVHLFGDTSEQVRSSYEAMEKALDTIGSLAYFSFNKLAMEMEKETGKQFNVSTFKKMLEMARERKIGASSSSTASPSEPANAKAVAVPVLFGGGSVPPKASVAVPPVLFGGQSAENMETDG
eukprot:s3074_g1.t1